jgi:hypothetical protein
MSAGLIGRLYSASSATMNSYAGWVCLWTTRNSIEHAQILKTGSLIAGKFNIVEKK